MKQLSYGVLLALCCCTTLWAQNGSKQVELKEVTVGKFADSLKEPSSDSRR